MYWEGNHMAGWETQDFERGWGGTGRTFLSHYKRLEPLGKHPPRPPRSQPAAGSAAPVAGRCCSVRPQAHPRPPPWMERGMRCPERGSLSPRCSGWRWPRVSGAGGRKQQGHLALWPPLGSAHGEGGRGECAAAGGCFAIPRGARFPLPSEDGQKCSCFVLLAQTGLYSPLPTSQRIGTSLRVGLLSTTLLLIPLSLHLLCHTV